MKNDLKYLIGLIGLPGIGDAYVKKLLTNYGSAEAVFAQVPSQSPDELNDFPSKVIDSICAGPNWGEVDSELEFIDKNEVVCVSHQDENYPRRLKFCADAPALLYTRGTANLNHPKILAVVGTRRATPQGKKVTEEIVEQLADQNVLIISGLAFGIDIEAHKAALKYNVPTIGVMANGMGRVYPAEHKGVARQMENNGALVTEHRSGAKPDRENFPKRNRIVAGMADAILVVESQAKGGSLITADLGFGYGRDVFAIPGRPTDPQSKGCHALIRTNKAGLVESARDIKYAMNWRNEPQPKQIQKQLFVQLSPIEEKMMDIVKEKGKLPLDELCMLAKLSVSQASVPILTLEMNGLIRTLPGKVIEEV